MEVKISTNKTQGNTKVRIVPKTAETVLDVSNTNNLNNIVKGVKDQIGFVLTQPHTEFNSCKPGRVGIVSQDDWFYWKGGIEIRYSIIFNGVDTGYTFGRGNWLEDVLQNATNGEVYVDYGNGIYLYNTRNKQNILEFIPNVQITADDIRDKVNLFEITDTDLTDSMNYNEGFDSSYSVDNKIDPSEIFNETTGRFVICLAPYDAGIGYLNFYHNYSNGIDLNGDLSSIYLYVSGGRGPVDYQNLIFTIEASLGQYHLEYIQTDSETGTHEFRLVVDTPPSAVEQLNISVEYTDNKERSFSASLSLLFFFPNTINVSTTLGQFILQRTVYSVGDNYNMVTDPENSTINSGSWRMNGSYSLYGDPSNNPTYQAYGGEFTINYGGYDATWNPVSSNTITHIAGRAQWAAGNTWEAYEGTTLEFAVSFAGGNTTYPIPDDMTFSITKQDGANIDYDYVKLIGFNAETGKYIVEVPYNTLLTGNTWVQLYPTLTDKLGNKVVGEYGAFQIKYISPTLTIGWLGDGLADKALTDKVTIVGKAIKFNPAGRYNYIEYTNIFNTLVKVPITFDSNNEYSVDIPLSDLPDGRTWVTVKSMEYEGSEYGYSQDTLVHVKDPLVIEIMGPATVVVSSSYSVGSGSFLIDWDNGTGEVDLTTLNARTKLTENRLYTVKVRNAINNGLTADNIRFYETSPDDLNYSSITGTAIKAIRSFGSISRHISTAQCVGLVSVPAVLPATIINTSSMFSGASELNDPNISNWDMSRVIDTNRMFTGCTKFNQPLNWDFSKIARAEEMFAYTAAFNEPMLYSNWRSLTYANAMFYQSNVSLRDISTWCVPLMTASAVTEMGVGKANIILPVAGTCPVKPLDATYDSYQQTMTVRSTSGTTATTTDSNGNVIGSGIVGSDGVVTYSINEGQLPNGEVLTTTSNGLSKTHNLIASFRVASGITNPEVPWFSITKNMVENMAYVPFDNDAEGSILIEYVGKETIEINLAEHRGDYSVDPYPSTWKNGEEVWDVRVRFKNLNTPIYLDISEADYIYNFYDDGVSNIGYHIKSTGTTYALKVKHIPNSIPTTLVNMNFMFAVDDSNETMFEAGVIDTIANWDVSHVTSMQGTFYGTTDVLLPITGWVPLSVTDMSYMFAENTDVFTDLSGWCVPLVTSLPIGFNTLYLKSGNTALPVNYYPVWGTCPRGENIAPDEMYFSTTAGSLSYQGMAGDVITLSDSNTFTVIDGNVNTYTVPSGKHKVKLVSVRSGYVGLAGGTLVEIHNFPTIATINNIRFRTNINSPNLIKVPTTLPSNLTDLTSMFSGADSFNQPIGNWDVSKVTIMKYMFASTGAFNQPIGLWNVSAVSNMESMFSGAQAFNQPLDNWDVSSVVTTQDMFASSVAFNQDLPNWNVSNLIIMSSMFSYSVAFNGNISNWNTGNVTDMYGLFRGAKAFNQPIGNWDVSNVTNMSWMFANNTAFDQPLNSWNTGNVTRMTGMFNNNNKFDKPIGLWNVANVNYMDRMFQGSTYLNRQDLSQWCVGRIGGTPPDFCPDNYSYQNWPVWGTCPRGENLV